MVAQKVDEIANQLDLANIGEYEACYAIYKYITSHVKYDDEHVDDDSYTLKYTAYAALFNGKAVCQGYSALFYLLANQHNVSTRIVSGYDSDSKNPHAWNIVQIDDKYYNVDCTWDAGKKAYDYFLKCDASFSDHKRDGEYASKDFYEYYPMADKDYILKEDYSNGEVYKSGYYSYKLSTMGSALITAYSGKEKSIVVPAKLDGFPVYAIDKKVFNENCTAETITLSEGIKGWYCSNSCAFLYCPNLKTINLPSTVGFSDRSDYDLVSNNGLFHLCEKLQKITVSTKNPYLKAVDNVLFTKDMKTLLFYPMGKKDSSYIVPSGTKYIYEDAFEYQPYLTSVKLPDSVDTIGWWAFNGAGKLSSIVIPDNCQFIGEYAFCGTALKSINIPAKVESIVAPAFAIPTLEKITVSQGNPYFYVKDGVLMSKMKYGDVTEIALECYPAMRKGDSYTIPDDITVISPEAFEYAKYLKSVTGGKDLQSICFMAFYECNSLEYCVIPDGVKSIEQGAFANCYSLKTVFIPASVKNIEDAFYEPVILFGNKGSAAQTYAKGNNIKFQAGTKEDAVRKAEEIIAAEEKSASDSETQGSKGETSKEEGQNNSKTPEGSNTSGSTKKPSEGTNSSDGTKKTTEGTSTSDSTKKTTIGTNTSDGTSALEGSKTSEEAVEKIAAGTVYVVGKNTYKVISPKEFTVGFVKAPNKKSVTVPATVRIEGKVFKIVQISAKAFTAKKIRKVTIGANVTTIKKKAFSKSKAKKIVLKTSSLKKSSVKGCLKGSKVKTIQVKVGSKKKNKKQVKLYKKIFTKKNTGRKVKVR